MTLSSILTFVLIHGLLQPMASHPDVPFDQPPSRGHKKRDRTREQLVAAEVALLADKGEDLTVSDVVAAAKVSNGTFYNYFADRDELIRALAERSLSEFTLNAGSAAATQDPALRVATTAMAVLTRARFDRTWAQILLRLTGENVGQGLRAELEAGYAQKRFSAQPDDVTLDQFLGLISLSVRRFVHDDLPEDHAQKVVARGLMALGLTVDDAAAVAKEAETRTVSAMPSPRVA